jgi:hypothetical protein
VIPLSALYPGALDGRLLYPTTLPGVAQCSTLSRQQVHVLLAPKKGRRLLGLVAMKTAWSPEENHLVERSDKGLLITPSFTDKKDYTTEMLCEEGNIISPIFKKIKELSMTFLSNHFKS